MKIQLTKFEAATRQLNAAIHFLFEGRDSVPVYTLANAAGRILSDLVEHQAPGQSWRSNTVKSMPDVPAKEIYAIINRTPNFLKHADQDPNGIEIFEDEEIDDFIYMATLECGEMLNRELSIEMQAFQVWYMAAHPERIGEHDPLVRDALSIMPGLRQLERQLQLRAGQAFLAEQLRESQHAV